MNYDWKPIDSVPKDGTDLYLVDVDFFGRKSFVYEGWYKENGELFSYVEGIPLLESKPKFWDYKIKPAESTEKMNFDWKSIDTAPKDGSYLNLSDTDGFYYEGFYSKDMESWVFDTKGNALLPCDPLYWDHKIESKEWKPCMDNEWIAGIDTAPKNGTFFDVWAVSNQDGVESRIPDVRFRDGKFQFASFSLDSWVGVTATHWRHKPEGPTKK